MKTCFAATLIAAAVAGCASTPPTETSSSNAGGAAPSATAPAPRSAATSGNTAPSGAAASSAATAPIKHSVYFDYDSNAVKEEFAPVVQSNARYVAQQKVTRVKIEGNTDERGSREYNLALGQRRADAVKQRMTLLGVPAQQIETVSFGEEKPRAAGEDEKSRAENRRADIVYGR
jgi:peptidoglycan-associated lipoprotein